jgi:hypothetical protein
VTPLDAAAAALDRRAFLRAAAAVAGAGLLPTGCGGGTPPPSDVALVVLTPRTYAVFNAAACTMIGPRGAALIDARMIDPAAEADAILARSPALAAPLSQALLVLEFGIWPLVRKVRPFTSLTIGGQRAVVTDLAESGVELKRALYGGVRSLAMATFYASPTSRALTGYPGPFGTGDVTITDGMVPNP